MSTMSKVKVNVTFGKKKFLVEIDPVMPVRVFKDNLEALTDVNVRYMKVMGFEGGVLKCDSHWRDLRPRPGMELSVEEIDLSVSKPEDSGYRDLGRSK